jgi:valyl-tRNA synthetase
MELETRYDPKALEPRLYAEWQRCGYFRGDEQDPRAPYAIVIPPPNVTGQLHLGHALNNGLQDVLVRWQRMRGAATLWLPGTDHAGIATQNVVEKELRKEGKKRHDLGREKFLERVWAWKEKNGSRIIEQLMRLGCSCDWRRERFTMDEGLSRAVLEVFVRLYEKGLIYRGERLVNWCPRCATALSDEEAIPHETEGGLYKIRYPLAGDATRGLTVATTRPETMLGDTAVAVHPEDERYRDFIGKTVILPLLNREIPVIADGYVDRAFGTGALKITPAHDPNDFEVGERHGLPRVNVLTPDGKINEAGGPYAGLDRFEARKRVLADLEAAGLLEGKEKHKHNIPRCERCDTVLEYYLSKQWFVRMKPLAEPAIRVVKEGKVKFTPERWTAVYLHWMENIRDWCISRQLWWGHRIPVWYCANGHETCARAAPSKCGTCGSAELSQDPDVLDTWFSSWLWPFSTMGWPEKTPTLAKFYPTQTLVTGFEIIFFWVARMIMAGLEFMGEVPFRDVLIHGIVRDEQGRKMSKSLGNGIDPIEVIDETSADALRFTMLYLTPEGQDTKISKPKFELGRNFCTKLWNAARLVLSNLGGYGEPREVFVSSLEDEWILSRLASTTRDATRALEEFRVNAALQALYDFTWGDFCDWWLEIAKPRLYAQDPAAKREAQTVAVHVLERLLRLLHPFIPFLTEELWQKLKAATGMTGEPPSLMIAAWPEPERHARPEIEARFAILTSLVREIRNVRAHYNIPPAKPVRAIVAGGAASQAIVEESRDLVLRLAKLEALELASVAAKPRGAAIALVKDLEVYVPLEGLVDFAKERARVEKELAKSEQQLAGVRAKLAAPGFADRAPAEVVEKTRATEAEIAKQVESLAASLRDLA